MPTRRKIRPARGRRHHAPRSRPPRVYLAAPLSLAGTPRYARLLAALRTLRPCAEIVEGLSYFESHEHWRRMWPRLRRSLAGVVFVTDADGWIGRGTLAELTSLDLARCAVYHLSPAGALTPASRLRFGPPHEDDWRRYCRVVRTRARA